MVVYLDLQEERLQSLSAGGFRELCSGDFSAAQWEVLAVLSKVLR